MKQIDIEPLTETEEGYLVGGFASFDSPDGDDVDALWNGNCSDTSGWLNGNCGCGTCDSSIARGEH